MKQLIVKIALFVFIIFLVDKPIGFSISKGIINRQYDQRIELLMKGKVRSDVVIIGSSRSLNGIDTGELEKNLNNQTAYNFGLSLIHI